MIHYADYRGAARRWLTPQQVAAIAASQSADAGLRDDLERLAGETTEDLGAQRRRQPDRHRGLTSPSASEGQTLGD